jgi:DNA adenine methylase
MGTITQPLKWHGGKHYLAKRIIELMPPHVHYVEPFFGGGAVLLAKDPEGVSEVVNDLNAKLIGFWTVLACPTLFWEFVRRCEGTPFAQDAWRWSENGGETLVERAWAFFVRMRQSRQGLGKDFATLSRNRTRRGMNEQVSSWLTAVDGLPEVHARLKRVVILNDDAIKVIRQQDGDNTLFYCDPPYLHETRASTVEYEHEMTREQHLELLTTLGLIKGKFILSGYPSELYSWAESQHGWRRVDIEIDNKASGKKAKEKKIECLWMNY